MATEKGGGWKGRILPAGGRTPLVVTLVVVLALGAAYYAYYRNQVAYYTGRNLRLLSTLTAQIDDRIETYAGYVRITAKDPEKRTPIDVSVCPLDAGAAKATAAMAEQDVKRWLEATGSGWLLRLSYAAPVVASDKPPVSWCAALPLEEVVGPVFTRKAAGAFDVLLLASENGEVLYRVHPPVSSSTLLPRNDEEVDKDAWKSGRGSDSILQVTNLSAFTLHRIWQQPEPFALAPLVLGAHHTDVRLDDESYVMFSQPHTIVRATANGGKAQRWIVCGLVSASRFRYDVSAVSISIILLGVALTLLALCCWPYLRIALIDPSQALTVADVVLIVFCTITGAAVLTLALLDFFAYQRIGRTSDEQLEKFSEKVSAGFAANLVRATDMLARAEALTATHLSDPPSGPGSLTMSALAGDSVIARWPYLKAIAWIDVNGQQKFKLSRSGRDPMVDVKDRRYFLDALNHRPWRVKDDSTPPGQHEYVLEWVRSMSTGEVAAVLAKHTVGNPRYPVISVRTELIDVSHAIRPPGVELAIIDEDGEVVYHSDEQRIGYENFFAESDQNRELRATVMARRAGMVHAMYWGDDQRMFVRPLEGSPWTLVTFRAKRLTRVLNVEGVLLTLLMLLMMASPFLFLYLAVLAIAPRYRAPALWPDSNRRADYLSLAKVLAALLGLFALHIELLTPWSAFFTVLVMPPLSIAATDLMLHRRSHPRRMEVDLALCLAGLGLLAVFDIGVGEIDSGHFFSFCPLLAKIALLLAIVLAGAVLLLCLGEAVPWAPLARRIERARAAAAPRLERLGARMTGRVEVGYSALYRLCGVLLLIIGAALPVIGLFTISSRVQTELLVKYGQLRAAADLEHRIEHLRSLSILARPSRAMYADMLQYELGDVFRSAWWLQPAAGSVASRMEDQSLLECLAGRDTDWTIPDSAAKRLPALYDDSIAIRQLYDAGSEDALWWWCPMGRMITLVRTVRLSADTAAALWKEPPESQHIVIRSEVRQAPLSKFSDPRDYAEAHHLYRDQWDIDGWIYLFTFALLGVALVLLFWGATTFIAQRVLLIDVAEPLWLARLPLSPTLGDHLFLVRREHDVDALTGYDPMGKGTPFFDVSFATLDRENSWWPTLERLDVSRAGQNVRLRDFEYGINDGAINEKKLQWLERLLALPDRTLIVVSAVSASYILVTPPPPQPPAPVLSSPPASPPAAPGPGSASAYFDRWQALIERFVWITAEELELRHAAVTLRTAPPLPITSPPSAAALGPLTWLQKETQHNGFLMRLREELDPLALTDKKRLIDEISERAETYYAGLWASCHEDEKLLLYQLAHNGLANGKNRRLLRRLIARGLVRREPSLELLSETFRLYVLAAAQKEELVSRSKAAMPASTWDSLRVPLFVVIVSFLLLLFTTQKDLLTTTTALTAALTTGLPLIVKLMGVFTERRLEGGAH